MHLISPTRENELKVKFFKELTSKDGARGSSSLRIMSRIFRLLDTCIAPAIDLSDIHTTTDGTCPVEALSEEIGSIVGGSSANIFSRCHSANFATCLGA